MYIKLLYINGKGKLVEKSFNEPMEVIGYVYRCWAAARNAASARRIKEMLDARSRKELPMKGGAE